jgi:hypothetical protein
MKPEDEDFIVSNALRAAIFKNSQEVIEGIKTEEAEKASKLLFTVCNNLLIIILTTKRPSILKFATGGVLPLELLGLDWPILFKALPIMAPGLQSGLIAADIRVIGGKTITLFCSEKITDVFTIILYNVGRRLIIVLRLYKAGGGIRDVIKHQIVKLYSKGVKLSQRSLDHILRECNYKDGTDFRPPHMPKKRQKTRGNQSKAVWKDNSNSNSILNAKIIPPNKTN